MILKQESPEMDGLERRKKLIIQIKFVKVKVLTTPLADASVKNASFFWLAPLDVSVFLHHVFCSYFPQEQVFDPCVQAQILFYWIEKWRCLLQYNLKKSWKTL